MEKPAPTCMPSWHHPSPLTIPELRRDICHLWVLKCESQKPVEISAAFVLQNVPCFFQAAQDWAVSRDCRCSGQSSLQNTPGISVPESGPLGSLLLTPQTPHHSLPKAQGHQHQERGCQPQDCRINSNSWAGKGVQDPKLSLTLGSALLSNNLLSPPSRPGRCWTLYLGHPPLLLHMAGSHRPFRSQLGIASSRQPSLTTSRQGKMLLLALSAPCPPCTSMLPLLLGEGRACWIFCLPPQAMKPTGPVGDLPCPSQPLTQPLPKSLLPG